MKKKWIGWGIFALEAILTLVIRWFDGYFEFAPLWILMPAVLVICGTAEEIGEQIREQIREQKGGEQK